MRVTKILGTTHLAGKTHRIAVTKSGRFVVGDVEVGVVHPHEGGHFDNLDQAFEHWFGVAMEQYKRSEAPPLREKTPHARLGRRFF